MKLRVELPRSQALFLTPLRCAWLLRGQRGRAQGENEFSVFPPRAHPRKSHANVYESDWVRGSAARGWFGIVAIVAVMITRDVK